MDFVTYGYNYRLPELQCAMLVNQIERLDSIVADRVRQQSVYAKELLPLGFKEQKHHSQVVHNMQSLVFTVPENVNRDDLIAYLKDNEIESTIGTYCQSACSYYKNKYNSVQPNASWLQNNTITLPCYEGLDPSEVTGPIKNYFSRQG